MGGDLITLFLARHGETDWTNPYRYQGHRDLPLNGTGRKQARALAQRLAGETLSAVYSSDLQRALETARIVAAGHEMAVVPRAELRELNFGLYEGLSPQEVESLHPDSFPAWLANPVAVSPPEGESLAQMMERVKGFLDRVKGERQGQQVLVVGHGGSLRAILCLGLGIDLERWWSLSFECASLSVLELHDSSARLTLLNDTCHLEPHP